VFEGCNLEVQRNEDEEKGLIGFFMITPVFTGRIKKLWTKEYCLENVPPFGIWCAHKRDNFRLLIKFI